MLLVNLTQLNFTILLSQNYTKKKLISRKTDLRKIFTRMSSMTSKNTFLCVRSIRTKHVLSVPTGPAAIEYVVPL